VIAVDTNVLVYAHREGGVTALLTEDRDFDRFPGFRTTRL
jgi:predicted nucleic acid-binding protein